MKNAIQNSKQIIKTKRFKVFFLCLMVSLVFWVISRLNGEETVIASLPVSFVNVPDNQYINNKETIEVNLKGSRYQLFKLLLEVPEIPIDVNNEVKKSSDTYYWLPSSFKSRIERQLPKDIQATLLIDTIHLNISEYRDKKVPVVFNNDIVFNEGYRVVGNINMEPDSIIVYGPNDVLKSLEKVETEKVVLQGMNKSFEETLAIRDNLENLKYSHEFIDVDFRVEQFVQAELVVPIKLINKPLDSEVTIFPKEAKVSFNVPLSLYNDITSEDFTITCDYNKRAETTIQIRLESMPELIQDIKLKQHSVAYLLKK